MSGLEGPALAASGGRFLGALAARAASALARKAIFRWRVSRRVRKRVEFTCRWRAYRKWLKTITGEELATPIEELSAPLAKRLDAALSTSSDWASADNHLSLALRLVERTYPAIAAAVGDAEGSELSESWAQQRSVVVREQLLQLIGPGAALGSDDLALILQRRSAARRAVRLKAFDLSEEALGSYFEQIEAPEVPPGAVLVLLGDFGSGKSEIAETWHRAAIETLVSRNDAPLPVWLSAREAANQTLESAVDRTVGPNWRQGRGARIAIDGLDETDPATAQTLLDAARFLTLTYTNVQVLLTARSGVVSPTATEQQVASLLTEDRALELVKLAGGKPHDTWQWTADMRSSVTRPFFALAAGVMLRSNEAPRGEADLIRALVEGAISKGTERSAVTSPETRKVLESLAIDLTTMGKSGLPFSDGHIARSSRLVAESPDGSLRFSLPIFQHWFSAQAILTSRVSADVMVSDAVNFNRWRWAAAVAAMSAPIDTVDDLLERWVSGNPGAAAWIIHEAFRANRNWREEGDDDLDAKSSGTRLLRALRAWSNALGAFAQGVLPYLVVEGPVGLGVTVRGHRIAIAIATAVPAADYVAEVPPGVHPLQPSEHPDWQPWMSGAAPQGDAWPWTMVLNMIAGSTLRKLSSDPFLGSPPGVWLQERRFDLARRLLKFGSLFHGSLSAEAVRVRALETFDAIGRNRGAGISIGSTTYTGAEVEDLAIWIDSTSTTVVESYLPDADEPNSKGHWVWDAFSPHRLLEFEVEVYGRACEAYDDALANSYKRLAWSMPSSAFAPFGALLELRYHDDSSFGSSASLTVIRVPMALLAELAPSGPDVVWSTSGRAVIAPAAPEQSKDWDRLSATVDTIRDWLIKQNREPLSGLGWSSTVADDMSTVRPASSVAARWLWDDLKTLGLGVGTFPQLQ